MEVPEKNRKIHCDALENIDKTNAYVCRENPYKMFQENDGIAASVDSFGVKHA